MNTKLVLATGVAGLLAGSVLSFQPALGAEEPSLPRVESAALSPLGPVEIAPPAGTTAPAELRCDLDQAQSLGALCWLIAAR
jgi:hypothetical protein